MGAAPFRSMSLDWLVVAAAVAEDSVVAHRRNIQLWIIMGPFSPIPTRTNEPTGKSQVQSRARSGTKSSNGSLKREDLQTHKHTLQACSAQTMSTKSQNQRTPFPSDPLCYYFIIENFGRGTSIQFQFLHCRNIILLVPVALLHFEEKEGGVGSMHNRPMHHQPVQLG